jgi:uncharacterized protein YdhG (YjbR/CyaY superfamily)
MKQPFTSVDEYIEQQPIDRQAALRQLRQVVSDSLPAGFTEMIRYDMIAYVVPLLTYPSGYHCDGLPLPFISLANQKHYLALYHLGIYMSPAILEWFTNAYAELGIGKLDIGKSCIRFKKPDQIPWALISELCGKISVTEYLTMYTSLLKK